MSVILKNTMPPIIEIAKLGYATVAVYSLLYQSAYPDERYDLKKSVRWKDRRDSGGTTNWSHAAIAGTLDMGKQKVISSINLLLDNGFIQVEGFKQSTKGSKHRIYRVILPEMIDTVIAVMPILPELPSVMVKRISNQKSFETASSSWAHDTNTSIY